MKMGLDEESDPIFYVTHKYIKEINVMEIKINSKSYKMRYGLRAMFVFEEITGKSFTIETMMDTYVLAYACIIAYDQALDFNEFIDYCDSHPEFMNEFNEYMSREIALRESMGKKKVVVEESR